MDSFSDRLLPLAIVEPWLVRHIDTPEFHALFPSGTAIPSARELFSNLIPAKTEATRDTLRQTITGKRVTLSVDLWIKRGSALTLICLNAHFIEKGKIKSQVIPVPALPCRPSSDQMRQQLEAVVAEYSLDLAAVITDSSTVLRKAVEEMGVFNPRCPAAQLHEAISLSMAKWGRYSAELDQIRQFARDLHHSSTMRALYFKNCAARRLKQVGVPELVDTRPGSLFHTLRAVSQQWRAVNATLKARGESVLPQSFHRVIEKLVELLAPFDECATKLCSSSAPITEAAILLGELAIDVREFVQRETEACPVYEFARLLSAEMEPRADYYMDEGPLKELLFFDPRAVGQLPGDWATIGARLAAAHPPTALPEEEDEEGEGDFAWLKAKIKARKAKEAAEDPRSPIEREIERYVSQCGSYCKDDLDALSFWHSHSRSFPLLRSMALRALTIPTSAPSAARVMKKAGLTSRARLRREPLTTESIEFCLLTRIGEEARALSYLPPPLLVPPTIYAPTRNEEGVVETHGRMSGESEGEMPVSDDEQKEF